MEAVYRMHLNFGHLSDLTTPQIYVVGGTIRDILLGRTPVDIDIAVYPDPASYARRLTDKFSGRLVVLGKPDQMLYRVVTSHQTYDITQIEGKSIQNDLLRRDFTINAIAFDVSDNKFIDHTGGQQDLSNRTVRMISEQSLRDDPIRLIRAYRLAAGLSFDIEPATQSAIAENAKLIGQAAGERVRDELYKILSNPSSHKQLVDMAANGLLFYIVPELSPLRKLPQHSRTHRTVFEHSMDAYLALERYLQKPPILDNGRVSTIGALHQPDFAGQLKLSILLHNIGKAVKPSSCAGRRYRYTGYARRGASQIESIAKRLRLSNRDTVYIGSMVQHHRRPWYFFKAHQRMDTGGRLHMVRFLLNLAPYVSDLFLHALASKQTETDKNSTMMAAFQEFAGHLLSLYQHHIFPRIDDDPILSGTDLIHRFGLNPSPLFKIILKRIEELRLTGDLKTAADAEKWVQTFLDTNRKSLGPTHK